MLQETTMIFVCRQQILAEEPGPIGGHIIHRIKLITHKAGSHQADTLLRELRAYRVHVVKRGRQPVKAVTPLSRVLNSSSLIVACRRGRCHHLPSQRNSMFRVGSEQGVQESSAAAR